MPPGPRCRTAALWLCRCVGIAAAICLWGVGAEALHTGLHLAGGVLLADAVVVSFMESLFACQFVLHECCGQCQLPGCDAMLRALTSVDTYKRSIVYTLLSVPCFVHYRRTWLPLLPGLLLLLAAVLQASRHCLQETGQGITKIPTFVRFDEDSDQQQQQQQQQKRQQKPQQQQQQQQPQDSARPPPLSHQSSFASSDEFAGHLGSKDSGIEASRRDPPASKPRPSSPDRCCLLMDDGLACHE